MYCPDCGVRLRVVSTEHHNGAAYRYLRCSTCATNFKSVELFTHLVPTEYQRTGDNPATRIYSDEDIRLMRQMHSEGKSRTYVADVFGTTPDYVSDIVNYRRRTTA